MASGRLERRLAAVMGSFLLSEERRSWLGAEQRAADVITESVLSSAAALSLDTAEVMAPSQTGKCITCMNQVVISDLCGSLAFRAQVRPVLREPVKDVCYERLLSPTPLLFLSEVRDAAKQSGCTCVRPLAGVSRENTRRVMMKCVRRCSCVSSRRPRLSSAA